MGFELSLEAMLWKFEVEELFYVGNGPDIYESEETANVRDASNGYAGWVWKSIFVIGHLCKTCND